MTDPWKVTPITNDTFKRVGYGDEYRFTYDDVIENYDYFRGYLPKKRDKVASNNVDIVYDQITNFNYGKRDTLKPIINEPENYTLTWGDIENWNYTIPDDADNKCKKDLKEANVRNRMLTNELEKSTETIETQQLHIMELSRKSTTVTLGKRPPQTPSATKFKKDLKEANMRNQMLINELEKSNETIETLQLTKDEITQRIKNAESVEQLNRLKPFVRRDFSGADQSDLIILLQMEKERIEREKKRGNRLTRRQKLLQRRRARQQRDE